MEKKFTVTAYREELMMRFDVALAFHVTNDKQRPAPYLRDQAEHWQNTIADALRKAGIPAKNISVFEKSNEPEVA